MGPTVYRKMSREEQLVLRATITFNESLVQFSVSFFVFRFSLPSIYDCAK